MASNITNAVNLINAARLEDITKVNRLLLEGVDVNSKDWVRL